MLTKLERAIKSNIHIYGVIKGAAINHSGTLPTITAPKVAAQKEVITRALEDGGITPDKVSYVEAHGTGTSLGDPIEVEALKTGLPGLYSGQRILLSWLGKIQYRPSGRGRRNGRPDKGSIDDAGQRDSRDPSYKTPQSFDSF